jgi:hypothetical protein
MPIVLSLIYVVLGGILERYMLISIERYGVGWMWRPIVMGMKALIYVVFDQRLNLSWPPTLIGEWFPALKITPAV